MVGQHSLLLFAYFENYPEVYASTESFIEILPAQTIQLPDIVYRPDWLAELQDQFVRIGSSEDHQLEYKFGDRSHETRQEDSHVEIHVNSIIRQYVSYDAVNNTFIVDCELLTPLQVGVW